MQEREYLDIDTYDHLVFRVKGDGRKYIASLRTDNWIIGGRSHDVWQAFLFARWACCYLLWSKRVLCEPGHCTDRPGQCLPTESASHAALACSCFRSLVIISDSCAAGRGGGKRSTSRWIDSYSPGGASWWTASSSSTLSALSASALHWQVETACGIRGLSSWGWTASQQCAWRVDLSRMQGRT